MAGPSLTPATMPPHQSLGWEGRETLPGASEQFPLCRVCVRRMSSNSPAPEKLQLRHSLWTPHQELEVQTWKGSLATGAGDSLPGTEIWMKGLKTAPGATLRLQMFLSVIAKVVVFYFKNLKTTLNQG